MKYKISGVVRDKEGKPVPNVLIDAFDSDFGTSEDYVGNDVTDLEGRFEMLFDDKAFKENFEFLDRKPDLFITVRDSNRLLHKSDVKTEAQGPEVFFEINLTHRRDIDDPYANMLQRTIGIFNSISDTVDMSQIDIATSLRQMIRALGNWSYYTVPKIMEMYGYPGPQVPRYPKSLPHHHSLPWNRKDSSGDIGADRGNKTNAERLHDKGKTPTVR